MGADGEFRDGFVAGWQAACGGFPSAADIPFATSAIQGKTPFQAGMRAGIERAVESVGRGVSMLTYDILAADGTRIASYEADGHEEAIVLYAIRLERQDVEIRCDGKFVASLSKSGELLRAAPDPS
jgi:hypothetical protein